MAVVGIDLGTTHTVIAAVRDGRASALKDKLGRALIPSVVSFPPKGEPKVGYEGRDRRTTDPINTVYSTKRLIGRPFESEAVHKTLGRFPFELKAGPGDATIISCREKNYTLPEISALVLQASRTIAEARLGSDVTDAVITVPAHFNDLQRAATKLAGKTAGFEVQRILNEPTAAALAYGFGKKGQERIAIYDFGGGTFDITILDLAENVFEVLATAGDTFLGGDDIDRIIAERMAEELQSKNKIDANNDPMVSELLRVAAEKLKLDLSTRSLAKARVDDLSFDFSMRRAEFEQIAEPFVTRSLAVCKEAMETAGIENKELQQVLLVGGSTRIPLVRRRISSFFNKMPQSRINPDEVVAIGAALQANALNTQQSHVGLPAAPIPRGRVLGSSNRSGSIAPKTQSVRPPGGSTQVGLAGLQDAQVTAQPTERRGEKSPQTLTGVGTSTNSGALSKTLSGSGGSIGKTLSGSGGSIGKTLSGVGLKAPPAPKRGIPKVPAPASFSPLSEGAKVSEQFTSGFEEITSVYPEELLPESLSGNANTIQGLEKIAESQQELEEDGSVVFDLAELEAEAMAEADSSLIASENSALRQATEQLEVDSLLEDLTSFDEPSSQKRELSLAEDDLLQEPDGRSSTLGDSKIQGPPQNASQLADASDSIFADVSRGVADFSSNLSAPDDSENYLSQEQSAQLPSLAAPVNPDALSLDQTVLGAPPPLSFAPVKPGEGFESKQRIEPSILEDLSFLQDSSLLEEDEEPPSDIGREKPKDLSSQLGAFASSIPPSDNEQPLFEQEVFSEENTFRLPKNPLQPEESATNSLLEGATESVDAPGNSSPLLIDVTPLALGVEVTGGYADQLLTKGTPIPSENTRVFATTKDNQTQVKVRVCQGDSSRFEENTVLGEVLLTQLGAAPRGQTTVEVTFSLDESGVLNVSARDPKTGKAQDAQLRLIGLAIQA